jgi:hypothetical protein
MRYGPWPRSGRLLRHLCFSSSFPRFPNPGGSGHVKGALAHGAQRSLPWTWPRRDYIALLEEEEKAPQQSAAACGCQGPATAMVPAAMAGGEGKEHAPATGARQHTARQSKTVRPTAERSDRRGVWGHAATTLHASPRLCRVRQHRGPRARPLALAGAPTAVAVLLVRTARPGLDAGALGHYIAKPCTEEVKPAEGQTQTERPSSPWEADVSVERTLRGRGDDQPSGVGRSGTAA